MSEKEALMRRISANSFAAYETALFLDTHPNNAEALAAMRKYGEASRALKAEYEAKFGMLTVFSPMTNSDTWSWVDSPWPWEKQ